MDGAQPEQDPDRKPEQQCKTKRQFELHPEQVQLHAAGIQGADQQADHDGCNCQQDKAQLFHDKLYPFKMIRILCLPDHAMIYQV